MKNALTTLVILVLAGCNSATGLLSRDLDSLRIALYPERPALVSGCLRDGIGVDEFLLAASASGVAEVTMGIDDEHPIVLPELEGVPFRYGSSPDLGEGCVLAFQKGLYWIPSYEWTIRADTISVIASAEIVNLTDQEWLAPVSICDYDGERLGGSEQPLLVGPGSRSLFWWTASTCDTRAVLSFGWPAPGRWTALLAVPAHGRGPVFTSAGNPWMCTARDTLWRVADGVLEVSQEMTVAGRGYSGILTLRNAASWPVVASARQATGLSSGAEVVLQGLADSLILEPGESRQYSFSVGFPD